MMINKNGIEINKEAIKKYPIDKYILICNPEDKEEIELHSPYQVFANDHVKKDMMYLIQNGKELKFCSVKN